MSDSSYDTCIMGEPKNDDSQASAVHPIVDSSVHI